VSIRVQSYWSLYPERSPGVVTTYEPEEPFVVVGEATESHKVVAVTNGSETALGTGFVFMVADREKGNRIAAALKHAVKLCGGKAEPF
jgi:hypothetical protein